MKISNPFLISILNLYNQNKTQIQQINIKVVKLRKTEKVKMEENLLIIFFENKILREVLQIWIKIQNLIKEKKVKDINKISLIAKAQMMSAFLM